MTCPTVIVGRTCGAEIQEGAARPWPPLNCRAAGEASNDGQEAVEANRCLHQPFDGSAAFTNGGGVTADKVVA